MVVRSVERVFFLGSLSRVSKADAAAHNRSHLWRRLRTEVYRVYPACADRLSALAFTRCTLRIGRSQTNELDGIPRPDP
jgi:hypothetical protein